MIRVERLDDKRTYLRCQSCYANTENATILGIVIGLDEKHTSSFRLCESCFEYLKIAEVDEN